MTEDDIKSCGAIYSDAFPQEYWGIDWDNENAADYIREFYEQKNYVGFIVENNDKIVGFLCGCTKAAVQKENFTLMKWQ